MKTFVSAVRRCALIAALVAAALLTGTGPTALASVAAQAAPPACNAVIPVFQDAITNCREINSNYACYGAHNAKAEATKRPNEKLRFKMPEDRAPIERFQTLSTLPYRTTFGAALMRLTQAGQTEPVTAILFGDAELTPTAAQVGRVFTLRKVGQNLVCQQTPPGLAIRVPSGKTGRISINGIEITLGSTAFVAPLSDTQTVVANLEGTVVAGLPALGAQLPLAAGRQTVVTLTNGVPSAFTEPAASPYASSALLQWLAKTGLPQVSDPNSQPVAGRPACGGPITFGQSIVQNNAVPGQECIYDFCANAGDTATVTMERVEGRLDAYVDLRAPDRSLLKWNDDSAAGNTNSQICNQVLPVSGCGYTIVARASGNDSNGSFRVTLNGQTACQATSNCQVNPPGLNLRSGPGTSFTRIATLAAGTKLLRLGTDAATGWVDVQVASSGQRGWVTNDPELLYCDDGLPLEPPAETAPSGDQQQTAPPEPPQPPPGPPPTPPKAGPFPLP